MALLPVSWGSGNLWPACFSFLLFLFFLASSLLLLLPPPFPPPRVTWAESVCSSDDGQPS